MANTTFKGTLRSEGGYSSIATATGTGVETTQMSISTAGFASLSLCASQHSVTSGNANVSIDEWAFYSDLLTASEISTLYNSGSIETPANLHTNNLQEVVSFGASNALNFYGSIYSGTINGGTTTAY